MRVVIIGSGNAATVLGRLIKGVGHQVVQVYSRDILNAEDLAFELGAEAVNEWDAINNEADVYLVAISDKALPDLHKRWQVSGGIVLHTAGTISKEVLHGVAKNYGILYPIQSMRKEKINYEAIPLLVDANNEEALALVTEFADTLSPIVRHADDTYRSHLHVAAVVVNNFTNHLYTLAEDYCIKTGVGFSLLKPLILETAERLEEFAPAQVQTGPASRNDAITINEHLKLLEAHPALLSLYSMLTQSIVNSMEQPVS